MKKRHLLAISVAITLGSAAAFAQTTTIAPAAGLPRMALDANKDGAIDRAEAAKSPKLAARFDQLDKDKDGKLAADEQPWRGGMRHRGGPRGGHGERGGMLRAADANHDGRISRAEAQAAQAQSLARFDAMDVNHDGYLDRADMQARMQQRRGECFAKADLDRNGQLSRAEFDKLHDACGPMHGRVAGKPRGDTPNPGPFPPKR